MNDSNPMTMKDIARELNVSVATVSRALKDSPRISEETRRMIQQYAREHNFYPDGHRRGGYGARVLYYGVAQ